MKEHVNVSRHGDETEPATFDDCLGDGAGEHKKKPPSVARKKCRRRLASFPATTIAAKNYPVILVN